jgi:hypothetical protein
MDDARRTAVRQWLQKAERDLASALRLLAGEPPFLDTAAYHCQQAAEKPSRLSSHLGTDHCAECMTWSCW